MNKEEWEEYITWEERVTDKLERWVKYNKPITREQAEETIDFICEQDNVIDRKIRELDKYKNIVDELERYIKDELILDFYNDDMPCELIVNKIENMIKKLKGSDN